MDDKYRPRSFEDLAGDPTPVTLINEPVPADNVGVLVPGRQRSLHAVVAQNLADVESLIARLELGVAVADSGRGPVRDLYVQCRRQRECWQRPCGWKSWNRALLPVIGWTQIAFEFLQGVAKRPPIFHE